MYLHSFKLMTDIFIHVCLCVCFQCSVTCGQGKTTRQVLCVINDQEVNASECDPDDRPTTEQDCAMSQCPSRSSDSRSLPSSPNAGGRNNLPRSQSHQWRTGPWGAVRHFIVHIAASLYSGQRPFSVDWHLKYCALSIEMMLCLSEVRLKCTTLDQTVFLNRFSKREIIWTLMLVSFRGPCRYNLWTLDRARLAASRLPRFQSLC